MTIALWLFAIQGTIGAFDTIYYHEWHARLPARYPNSAPELRIHAIRDFLYAILFGTFPYVAWQGALVWFLAAIMTAEIVLTLTDFVIEIRVRKPIGDVFAGERVTHAVMGILYGSMIANVVPVMIDWHSLPTGFVYAPPAVPEPLRWTLLFMAIGVFLSGLRDLYSSLGLPGHSWPWALVRSDSVA